MAGKTWQESGEGAFPLRASEYGGHGSQFGMTLRDYFAAKAMQGLIAVYWEEVEKYESAEALVECLGQSAYEHADAMLAAREVAQ